MDPSVLRKCVWEEMIYAGMRSKYFAELVQRYLTLDKTLRWAGLLAASGSVASAAVSLSGPSKFVVPIATTAVSLWLLISQYGSMARDAGDLHEQWNAIETDFENIWNALDRADAESNYQQICRRADGLSKSGTKFPNRAKRLEYWLDQTSKLAQARYA